jgi:hypothetical protein
LPEAARALRPAGLPGALLAFELLHSGAFALTVRCRCGTATMPEGGAASSLLDWTDASGLARALLGEPCPSMVGGSTFTMLHLPVTGSEGAGGAGRTAPAQRSATLGGLHLLPEVGAALEGAAPASDADSAPSVAAAAGSGGALQRSFVDEQEPLGFIHSRGAAPVSRAAVPGGSAPLSCAHSPVDSSGGGAGMMDDDAGASPAGGQSLSHGSCRGWRVVARHPASGGAAAACSHTGVAGARREGGPTGTLHAFSARWGPADSTAHHGRVSLSSIIAAGDVVVLTASPTVDGEGVCITVLRRSSLAATALEAASLAHVSPSCGTASILETLPPPVYDKNRDNAARSAPAAATPAAPGCARERVDEVLVALDAGCAIRLLRQLPDGLLAAAAGPGGDTGTPGQA